MSWSVIRCKHCDERLDGCRGLHGWWMHRATRSEFCADGVTLAVPLTPQDVEAARALAEAQPCEECGGPLPHRDDNRGRHRRYCSRLCSKVAAAKRASARDAAKRAARPAGEVA